MVAGSSHSDTVSGKYIRYLLVDVKFFAQVIILGLSKKKGGEGVNVLQIV